MIAEVGIVGLGAMGFNMAQNMERHGFAVAGFDVDPAKIATMNDLAAAGRRFIGVRSLADLVANLAPPRRVILLVPAEHAGRSIEQAAQLLAADDVLVDMGNSFFRDTERRQRELAGRFNFVGCGVSGGYAGALLGPCLMPGGEHDAWERMAPVFAAVAAKYDGVPCTAYIGPRGAGHFIKMVHNGIYYGDSQLIAEAYQILRDLAGMGPEELSEVFAGWNSGVLNSYLIEMTADIFTQYDEDTGRPMVEVIMDRAEQKGTGKWASQTSMDVGAPLGTINAALFARQISFQKAERAVAATVLPGPQRGPLALSRDQLIDAVGAALYAGKVCSYAAGVHHARHVIRGIRVQSQPRRDRYDLARRLSDPGQAARRHPGGLPPAALTAQPARRRVFCGGGGRATGCLAGSARRSNQRGHSGAGTERVAGLLRFISNCDAAGKPDPGTARLLRRALVRESGPARPFPPRVARQVGAQGGKSWT